MNVVCRRSFVVFLRPLQKGVSAFADQKEPPETSEVHLDLRNGETGHKALPGLKATLRMACLRHVRHRMNTNGDKRINRNLRDDGHEMAQGRSSNVL